MSEEYERPPEVISGELLSISDKLTPISTLGSVPVYKVSSLRRNGWFALIYGGAGVGKTTLAASAADSAHGSPAIMFDIDRTSKVIAHRDDVDVVYVYQWPDMVALATLLSSNHGYKTIIVDNISELSRLCLIYYESTIRSKDPRQHYAAATASMINLIARLRDYAQLSGCVVILTAWEGTYTDSVDGHVRIGYDLNPALQHRIGGLLGTVGYMRINDKGVRELHFEPSGRYLSKLQLGPGDNIPLTHLDPKLGPFVDTIIGGKPWSA